MATTGALTDPDVAALRAEAATGRPVTVWFTAAAVGVPAGGSAKVVAVGDAAEGDFIQVRPAGTRDTMFCAPNELTRSRPGRRGGSPKTAPAVKARATPRPAAAGGRPAVRSAGAATGRAGSSGAKTAGPVATGLEASGPTAPGSTAPGPTAPGSTAPGSTAPGSTAAGSTAAGSTAAASTAPGSTAAGSTAAGATAAGRASAPVANGRATGVAPAVPPAATKPARPRRRADPTGELSVSLTATADGEWAVEVRAGAKRIVAATPVPAVAVAAAAKSLPASVAEAIESSLEGARRRQRDRVQQLRAELDAAQQVLDQLGL
jgi:hypothetical protein